MIYDAVIACGQPLPNVDVNGTIVAAGPRPVYAAIGWALRAGS
jgi:hypothetical protein